MTGTADSDRYVNSYNDFWNMSFGFNPFESQEPMVLNYNDGKVPEFYWFILSRWSSYNGNNEWDIDADGDSLINGLDTDQDATDYQIGLIKMKEMTVDLMLMIQKWGEHSLCLIVDGLEEPIVLE